MQDSIDKYAAARILQVERLHTNMLALELTQIYFKISIVQDFLDEEGVW